jgi:HSP20 family molecular chaperone IbpA
MLIMATRYPVSGFAGMRQAMDRLMSDTINSAQFATIWPAGTTERGQSMLPVDAYATEEEVVILAAAPGIAAEEIEITVEKNTVRLSATIPSVAKSDHAQGATWYLHELPRGSFQRTLTLPMDVDAGRAEATFDNGVLRLVLPKAEAARARQIPVTGPTRSSEAMPELTETSTDTESNSATE